MSARRAAVGLAALVAVLIVLAVALRNSDGDDAHPAVGSTRSTSTSGSGVSDATTLPAPARTSSTSAAVTGSTEQTATDGGLGDRPILPPSAGQSATGLQATARCKPGDPGRPVAALSWRPADTRGQEQRAVVTIYENGFDSGNFRVGPALSPDSGSMQWEQIEGQALHYWRVLTLHDGVWRSSETSTFTGPTCPVDG